MQRISQRPRVVLLSGKDWYFEGLKEILNRFLDVAIACNLTELESFLGGETYAVFLCPWDFQGGTWREVCRKVQQNRPNLPIVVIRRLGEEHDWIEVLEAGCFDILCAPFSERQVLSVIEHAAASSEGRLRRSVA